MGYEAPLESSVGCSEQRGRAPRVLPAALCVKPCKEEHGTQSSAEGDTALSPAG